MRVFSGSYAADRAHDRASARWESKEPAAYSFDYDYCSGMCMGCLLRVTVRNGEVTEAVASKGECSTFDTQAAPTIEDIFAMEESDRAAPSTDSFEIEYDPNWGYPASVEIRCPYGTPDCGTGYHVTDFEVLE